MAVDTNPCRTIAIRAVRYRLRSLCIVLLLLSACLYTDPNPSRKMEDWEVARAEKEEHEYLDSLRRICIDGFEMACVELARSSKCMKEVIDANTLQVDCNP